MGRLSHVMLAALLLVALHIPARGAEPVHSWTAPDRAEQVAALIPGRGVAMPPPAEFLKQWTADLVARWQQAHPESSVGQDYAAHVAAAPADDDLIASVPDHISPFARVLSGTPDPQQAAAAFISFCPLCGAYGRISIDGAGSHHAVTTCCHQDLYEREADYPAGYRYRPNSTARFPHLDDTVKEVPAYVFTDRKGVKWELFIGTLFAHDRWRRAGSLATDLMSRFRATGDSLYAHKLAVLLDRVADVYYGLPFAYNNELATDVGGKPLTRAAWEAFTRPVRAGSLLGGSSNNCFAWNRRSPVFNRGWVFLAREAIWAEPFARVRHHPAFKEYSRRRYGDPEALERKITDKLLHDLALLFRSFKLESDYQDGAYTDLVVLAILLQDRYLFDFAAGHQECVLYNHHYADGMNGEGAPNYMAMLGGYYQYMADPQGWLEFEPDFLRRNPFFGPASKEWTRLSTVRGLPLEFADQHIYAFEGRFRTDGEQVRKAEQTPSMNWPGYGIGILRVGGPGHRQEVFLTYDRVSLHGASDKLGIECWVDGVPVMREGGYANSSLHVPLGPEQPAAKPLLALPYPRPIFDARRAAGFDAWQWVHSPPAHNTATVDDLGTGPGWGDTEGFGELLTYKGGEAPGTPGSRVQVLDCQDRGSFERYSAAVLHTAGTPVSQARRTFLAVETAGGRPYVVDVLRLDGGRRQALYLSGWADRVAETLPPVAATRPDMAAYLTELRGPGAPELDLRASYAALKAVELRGPAPPAWSLTWQTDYAAYAPRDPQGRPVPRPLPEGIGQVRLRLTGLRDAGRGEPNGTTSLLTAKGPWVAIINQPLPDNRSVSGNVGFRDAWDYLVEMRNLAPGNADQASLKSTFLHLLEGYREGEAPVVARATPLTPTGDAAPGTVALKLELATGDTDTLVCQPAPGPIELPDGMATDAADALVRRDRQGRVTEAHLVRGSTLRCGDFAARTDAQFTGTVADLIGDVTGTRLESALIVRPDGEWPTGATLAGRQMLVETINHHNEAYTIAATTLQPDGRVRVDLANHPPLSAGWYQVSSLDPAQPRVLKSNRQLWHGINTPWWRGGKAWFPTRGKTFTIKQTGSDRETLEIAEDASLAQEGIAPGDWFMIYLHAPGVRVTVPGDFSWRREGFRQSPMAVHSLRATGPVELTLPQEAGPLWLRVGGEPWSALATRRNAAAGTMIVSLPTAQTQGRLVSLLAGKPDWLKLTDGGPPQVTAILLDGQPVTPAAEIDLGRIPTPREIVCQVRDADNPLDLSSVAVELDGKALPLQDGAVRVQASGERAREATVTVDLARALGEEPVGQPAYHTLTVSVDDWAIDEQVARVCLSYSRLVKPAGDAIYLSDVKEVSAIVHGGLRKDCDYNGKPLRIRRVLYAKSLQTHVAAGGRATHSEVVYDLSPLAPRKRFCALIGISDDSGGGGSVTFEVQVERDGKWETKYASPVVRGGQEPLPINVDLAGARRLRLYCTDAGDGINSDHATWAEARLE